MKKVYLYSVLFSVFILTILFNDLDVKIGSWVSFWNSSPLDHTITFTSYIDSESVDIFPSSVLVEKGDVIVIQPPVKNAVVGYMSGNNPSGLTDITKLIQIKFPGETRLFYLGGKDAPSSYKVKESGRLSFSLLVTTDRKTIIGTRDSGISGKESLFSQVPVKMSLQKSNTFPRDYVSFTKKAGLNGILGTLLPDIVVEQKVDPRISKMSEAEKLAQKKKFKNFPLSNQKIRSALSSFSGGEFFFIPKEDIESVESVLDAKKSTLQ